MNVAADVYKGGTHAAVLIRRPDRVEFAYLPDYTGEPLAWTLPVSMDPLAAPAGQLPPFFVGLLPEGRRLTALIQVLKISADDELSLLLAVGEDTVGDVRVVPAGHAPTELEPMVRLGDAPVDFSALFERSVGAEFDRIAIPGVQPKVSGRMITFPAAAPAGPVIIKLDPPEYESLTANEAAMLGVADATGYRVPPRQLLADRQGRTALVVSRFDRQPGDHELVRFPVEDGCQVLGRYPADKYRLDTIDVIVGLADRCTAPAVARLRLVERFLLSYLAGDGDLHARNMAIWRGPSGLWEPTPVYDVVCTAVYGDMTLASPIAGRSRVHELGRNRFLEVCRSVGVPGRAAAAMLERRVPAIAREVSSALQSITFDRFASRRKVLRTLDRRAALLMAD